MAEHEDTSLRKAPTPGNDTYAPRAVLLAVLLLLVLVGGGLYLFYALRADSNLQDCVMQGRRNCAPVDPGSTGT